MHLPEDVPETERLEALKLECTPRKRRLCAQLEGDFTRALYWLAQELAQEHREEIRAQHRTNVILDSAMIALVLIEVIRIFFHS